MPSIHSEIPEHFICPLTMEMMKEPLFSKYGHNFERSAILQWLAHENTCPITRQPLTPSMLIPDHSLRLRMKAWKGAQEVELLLESDETAESGPWLLKVPSKRTLVIKSAVLRDEDEIQVMRIQAKEDLRRTTLMHVARRS
jgi:hypothetical protein